MENIYQVEETGLCPVSTSYPAQVVEIPCAETDPEVREWVRDYTADLEIGDLVVLRFREEGKTEKK